MRATTGHDHDLPEDAILAVDGGASKTDAVVVGLDGSVVAHRRGPGTNHQTIGWPAAIAALEDLRERVLAAAPVTIRATHVYLAGLDLPEEVAEARRALAAWHADVIDNDVFALLRTGTRERDAVAVICGTGMNAVGVRADGTRARFLAFGELSGDWGGGQMLGEVAIGQAMRAYDGRGPTTTLVDRLPAAVGLPGITEVVLALYRGELGPQTYSRFAPEVFAAARDGDRVAGSLVDRQADEIALMAASAIDRLELTGRTVPVVVGGGVVAAAGPEFFAAIEAALARVAPHAQPVVATARPVLGAALAALESAGAGSAVLDRVTAAGAQPDWPAVEVG